MTATTDRPVLDAQLKQFARAARREELKAEKYLQAKAISDKVSMLESIVSALANLETGRYYTDDHIDTLKARAKKVLGRD